MNRPPPVLSDRQRAFVDKAASALPELQREEFLRSVHGRLTGEPGDGAVVAAINIALGSIAVPEP